MGPDVYIVILPYTREVSKNVYFISTQQVCAFILDFLAYSALKRSFTFAYVIYSTNGSYVFNKHHW